MAKHSSPRDTKKTEEYYKLNTDAVDKLVNAEKNASKLPPLKDPAKQYRSDFLDRIPAPVKALFIKWWFNGAVCYFILWEYDINIYARDFLDLFVILTIVLGMVNDLLVNNALRFIATLPGENDRWMMFPKKKFWTFFANILYSFVVLYCVVWGYGIINVTVISEIMNGVEPILFGIIYVLFDVLFISMKNLFKTILRDAKNKVNKQ